MGAREAVRSPLRTRFSRSVLSLAAVFWRAYCESASVRKGAPAQLRVVFLAGISGDTTVNSRLKPIACEIPAAFTWKQKAADVSKPKLEMFLILLILRFLLFF